MARRSRAGGWWRQRSLTLQAIAILALAIGPLLISMVMLATYSRQDSALDKEVGEHRVARVLETQVLKEVVDAETAVRGYLLTREPAFLDPYEHVTVDIPQHLDRLAEHEGEDGHGGFAGAVRLVEREFDILTRLASVPPNPNPLLRKGRAVMDRFREQMGSVMMQEDEVLAKLLGQREARARAGQTVLLVGGGASIAGAGLGGTLLIGGIVRRLRVVTCNAERVATGEDLEPVRGQDEIAQLAGRLQRSARLLRARESELRQAKVEADRANQAKSDFISRMSHELRTPLNAILGFAQILREDADETTASDVDQIFRAGKHLLSLINEVLDLSRIESGQFAISLEQVAVGEVIQECVELMVPLAGARRITISNNVKADTSLHVLADRQRLKQVVLNLLSNAVKYNKESGSVDLSCSVQQDKVRLSVRDTGPGIPERNAEQIFVPFARLGAETTEVEGTGLGLALSLRLMQMMEGDLSVGSTGSQGTEFWLELKVADTKALAAEVESGAERPSPRLVQSLVTILQVEDNPTNVRLLERIMSRRPHVQLVTVQEGNEAVKAARTAQPALILLDVNLPDISGREVLARLRAEPATSHIPVVMLSADASSGQVEKLLASGASAYVTKPLDVGHFLSVIDEVLERGKVA